MDWQRGCWGSPAVPAVALETVVTRYQTQVMGLWQSTRHEVILTVESLARSLRWDAVEVAPFDAQARLKPAGKAVIILTVCATK